MQPENETVPKRPARCEKYDLPAESCAHCTGAEERARAEARPGRREMGPWFTAQFPGECAGCGDPIGPGDTIRADGGGGYLCDPCGDPGEFYGGTG